jgi:subtilisin
MLAWCGAAQAQPQAERSKLFVIGADASHKRALMAVAGEGSIRMEFESPGNAAIFSGEFTRGQVVALERLGARFEPVEEISPAAGRQRFGHLQSRERPRPSARPVCGDGTCSGRETASSCPADCSAEPPGGGEGRVCEPRDQEEYQTLLSSGVVSDSDGAGVRLFVIDTGTTVSHPDLRVSICRNVTGRKPRNNCGDSNGHGTHTSGSAAATGGSDGLGLYGGAPGATLGFIKICGSRCFSDALVRGIEDAVAHDADIISLSFSASDTTALRNAVLDAAVNDVLFFAATSNDGPAENSISYPAAYPEVVGVGILGPNRIANRMTGRGGDDGNDSSIVQGEVELIGGGFVVESTSKDGCYEVLSGTSMATPAIAGFAAANWQSGGAGATRSWLRSVAEDVDSSGRAPGYDPSSAGFDRISGYGLPRTTAGTDGSGGVTVSVPGTIASGSSASMTISGPVDAHYRVGIGSPQGDWTFGEFTTDSAGQSPLTFTPWTDPGTWLITVDFGGGRTDFAAGFATFVQP